MKGRICATEEGALKGVVTTSLSTPHHGEVNSAGIPKRCAIISVMT